MSTQVKTPDEVAALARQLWALHREGHEDVIQLYLSELVDRLRKDKPIVLVDRQELTDLRAGIDRIEGAIGALRSNGNTTTAAPSITPKAAAAKTAQREVPDADLVKKALLAMAAVPSEEFD